MNEKIQELWIEFDRSQNQRIVGIHNRVWVPPGFFKACSVLELNFSNAPEKIEHEIRKSMGVNNVPFVMIRKILPGDPPHPGRTPVFRRRMTLPKYACRALEIKKGDKVEFWMVSGVLYYRKCKENRNDVQTHKKRRTQEDV